MPANSKLLVGDQFNRPAPQYYNPITDQYEYLHGSDGALHAKLVPSEAAIAAELSVSQRDIVARAIDDIINTIGLENIACFLPMWENTGTELRDLIHPDLRFRVVGATPGVVGPFGYGWAFDGINDYIVEAPAIETAGGTAEAALDSGTKMLAQRLRLRDPLRPVAFVRLNIRRVGNPSGTLAVEIREDSGGVPGSTVVATSGTLSAATGVDTSFGRAGFAFTPAAALRVDRQYWIVLKWSTATTVDASNYVAWSYAAAYGEPRAVYDGTAWAATSGHSHGFSVHYDFLALDEFTYITAAKPMVTSYMERTLFGQYRGGNTQITLFRTQTPGAVYAFSGGLSLSPNGYREVNFDRYVIYALSFSKSASADKVILYHNGQRIASASGTAGQGENMPSAPLFIGARIFIPSYAPVAFMLGHIGAFIVARTPLTQQQIANVTRHLLSLRRYKVAGV